MQPTLGAVESPNDLLVGSCNAWAARASRRPAFTEIANAFPIVCAINGMVVDGWSAVGVARRNTGAVWLEVLDGCCTCIDSVGAVAPKISLAWHTGASFLDDGDCWLEDYQLIRHSTGVQRWEEVVSEVGRLEGCSNCFCGHLAFGKNESVDSDSRGDDLPARRVIIARPFFCVPPSLVQVPLQGLVARTSRNAEVQISLHRVNMERNIGLQCAVDGNVLEHCSTELRVLVAREIVLT